MKAIIEVTKQDDLDNMKKQFFSVFNNTDPFGEMFNESIKHRLLLCPVESYRLEEDQYFALIEAIKAEGNNEFYISETELKDCFSIVESPYIQPRNWKCDVQLSYEEYNDEWFYLENSIYSPTGKWGVMISHEDHAVIGGSKNFIDTFKHYYPKWSLGYENFIQMWRNNELDFKSNTDWIEGFLKHIYG